MTFASGMIGLLIFWYMVAPKSFGRHYAECVAAYRTALSRFNGGKE